MEYFVRAKTLLRARGIKFFSLTSIGSVKFFASKYPNVRKNENKGGKTPFAFAFCHILLVL